MNIGQCYHWQRVFMITAIVTAFVACAGRDTPHTEVDKYVPDASSKSLVDIDGQQFPLAPKTPDGPLSISNRRGIDQIIEGLRRQEIDREVIAMLGRSGDARILWLLNDLLLFSRGEDVAAIVSAFEQLSSTALSGRGQNEMTDRLIAWDLAAPPGYREIKAALFTLIEPKWAPFFEDMDSAIDWRLVTWGGVWIDGRMDAGPGRPCYRCIPALDDPPVTAAIGGNWYPDDGLIFGVVINNEARAYPKNIMQVHEMINDTLGGRRFGMPYCTLCGSAQAYYTDGIDGIKPVLRTSGLLARSNKLMYDITTMSAIDTFSGRALSGPLHDAGIVFQQASVVTSTWGEWKRSHPETTMVAEDGGVAGSRYPIDPLRGRDDQGPIFPVGDVDPRLGIQELVLGVNAPDGTPLAFPVGSAVLALRAGEPVELKGIRLELDGSGVRAFRGDYDAAGHEAYWFAWSQFMPGSLIWQR